MAQRTVLSSTKGSDWDKLAKQIFQSNDNPSAAATASLLAQTDARLPFSKAEGILDNGCGTGIIMATLLNEFATQLPSNCSLICSDFSEGMVNQLEAIKHEQIAKGNQHWSRLKTIVSDATDMSTVGSDTQSHILAGWVYFMTPDPRKCLTESRRMLKQGGVLGLSSWKDSQWLEVMRQLGVVFPGRQVPDLPKQWTSAEAVKQEMQQTGFKDVVCVPVTVYMGYETHEKLVRFLINNLPPMIAAVEGLGKEEIDKLVAVMVQKCKTFNAAEPGRLSGETLIAVGTK